MADIIRHSDKSSNISMTNPGFKAHRSNYSNNVINDDVSFIPKSSLTDLGTESNGLIKEWGRALFGSTGILGLVSSYVNLGLTHHKMNVRQL